MKALSLFSGIGGLDIAAEWAGIQPIAFCECNKFCQSVLRKHWPNVPIFDDIRNLTAKDIGESPRVVYGGFPCQPFSAAGKRKGVHDDRHLWPEMLRVIREAKPDWVVAENVANFAKMELDNVLTDLEAEGYETWAFISPACAIGAPHRRDRLWIIANSNSERRYIRTDNLHQRQIHKNEERDIEKTQTVGSKFLGRPWPSDPDSQWETYLSLCGGMDDGATDRTHRLQALGNAVVPQHAYPIFKAIRDVEDDALARSRRLARSVASKEMYARV